MQACQALGSYMIEIESQEENDMLNTLTPNRFDFDVLNLHTSINVSPSFRVWAGALKEGDSEYRWIHSSVSLTDPDA